MTNPWLSQPNIDPFEERNMTERCGYTMTDSDGIEEPCDRLAEHWRWYQDVEHEDLLEAACDWHANEGGRRMHAAEAGLRRCESVNRELVANNVDLAAELDRLRAEVQRLACILAEVSRENAADAPQGAPGTSGSPDLVPVVGPALQEPQNGAQRRAWPDFEAERLMGWLP